MMLAFVLSISLSVCFSDIATAVSTGTVRLYRNGTADTSQSWSSGIVQIYYSSRWGNICYDSSFGLFEANVICHQLGYNGVSSYSNTGDTTKWGYDSSPTAMGEVSCGYSSTYLTITQCYFNTFTSSSTCNNRNDVTVSCYSDKISDSPIDGAIRLSGGKYSNQGLLEVYCNGQWGTVCDDYFYSTQAQVACAQLGYNDYTDYDHLTQQGTSSQPIFLRSLSHCTLSNACLTQCGGCPLSGIGSVCSHDQDVTLECSYSPSNSRVYTDTIDTCIYYDYSSSDSSDTSLLVGEILGGSLLFIGCIILSAAIPLCIRANARSRSRLHGYTAIQQPLAPPITTHSAIDPYHNTPQQPVEQVYSSTGYPPTQQQPPPGYYAQPPPIVTTNEVLPTGGGYPEPAGFPQEQDFTEGFTNDPQSFD